MKSQMDDMYDKIFLSENKYLIIYTAKDNQDLKPQTHCPEDL